jgi:FdhE protein
MAMRERDREVLSALAVAREKHEELADLLDFYYDLYEFQFEAKADLPQPEVRDEMAKGWRLEGGIPQLTFDQLQVAPETLVELVGHMAEVLRRYNPSWEFGDEGGSPGELLAMAKEIFETWETLTSPGASNWTEQAGDSGRVRPLALAVGFSLAPHLYNASDTILPGLDLVRWGQGYCPVCGGRPNFALLEAARGARQLLCSRCNSLWPYSRVGCPFCKSREKQHYYPSEDGVYRLYVCPDCRRYLKTVDLRELQRDVQPLVERLLTVGMDLVAQEEGYRA